MAEGAPGRAVVVLEVELVVARLAVVAQPVGGGVAAHPDELVIVQVKQDAVADHVAGRSAGHELLGHVHREVGHAVDPDALDQLQRIRALEVEVHHVVRLVEQHRRLPPRLLLAPPVRELVGHDRVDVGAGLRVAQELGRVFVRVQDVLEGLGTHL